MGDTFGQITRSVLLRVPLAPVFLAEDWVRESYRRAWEYRKPMWSFARAESAFITNVQKGGLVSVTRGSKIVSGIDPLVTPGGLQFVDSDETRQFRVSANQPVYTIECVEAVQNTAQLDRVYTGTTNASAQATVLDAYITMPPDFERFIVVLDPGNFWQLRHWVTDEELNSWDPQRSSSGTPWALVSRRQATIPQLVGLRQYELWPYSTSDHEYWMFYAKRPTVLSEDDEFPSLLADRSDIIRQGALALAAEWPGTETRKNPYFNLALSRRLRDDAELELAKLEVTDEDIYPTWWEKVNWVDNDFFSPVDSRYMQSHDV